MGAVLRWRTEPRVSAGIVRAATVDGLYDRSVRLMEDRQDEAGKEQTGLYKELSGPIHLHDAQYHELTAGVLDPASGISAPSPPCLLGYSAGSTLPHLCYTLFRQLYSSKLLGRRNSTYPSEFKSKVAYT